MLRLIWTGSLFLVPLRLVGYDFVIPYALPRLRFTTHIWFLWLIYTFGVPWRTVVERITRLFGHAIAPVPGLITGCYSVLPFPFTFSLTFDLVYVAVNLVVTLAGDWAPVTVVAGLLDSSLRHTVAVCPVGYDVPQHLHLHVWTI